MSSETRKPILIAGGGLASLLLAQSLRRSSIPFRIFERDASISFRAQGYRLRLSAEGLDAVEQVLGPDAFQRFWDVCGKTGGNRGYANLNAVTGEESTEQSSVFFESSAVRPGTNRNTTADALLDSSQSRGGKTIGISRGDMRAIFLEGCEPYVEWSREVTGYQITPMGVQACFADGTKSVEGDLLIGGEGVHSQVAKQLSDGKIKVYDTGARGIHGQAPTSAFRDLGEGVWRAVDKTQTNGRVFVITNVRSGDMDNPEIEFGWTLAGQPGVIQQPDGDDTVVGRQAAEIAKSLTRKWHPKLRSLFDNMNEAEAAYWRVTCSTPSGVPVWDNEPRVTVIGDAVHAMTPAGGIGANTAMRDSAFLGKLLAEEGGWTRSVTAAFEHGMRLYASEAVAASYGAAQKLFGISIDEEKTPLA